MNGLEDEAKETAKKAEWRQALRELAAKDEVLGAWIKTQGELEDFQTEAGPEPYLSIVKSIISQQLSVKAADTIYGRLEALFPDGVIRFAELAEMEEERLRSIGLSARKVKSVKDLCGHILDGRFPDAQGLKNLEDEAIIGLLCEVYGVGRWTAENFLIFQLERPDVLPAGDLMIRKGFARLFRHVDSPAEIEEVREHAKKWAPYRTAAAKLLWMAVLPE